MIRIEQQKVWDNHLTLRQNYEKIGLVTDVNHLDQVQPTENPLVRKLIFGISYGQNLFLKKLSEKRFFLLVQEIK